MNSIRGFLYFFQSNSQHIDGYFVQCFFVSGEMKNSMRLVN